MPKISQVMKEETEQLVDQSSDDYSNGTIHFQYLGEHVK